MQGTVSRKIGNTAGTRVAIACLSALFLALCLAMAPLALLAQTDSEPEREASLPVPQVDINNADAETLALALDGVGMTRALDIIAHREEHGDFTTVEALQEVNGIGPATLERNRDRIVIVTEAQ